MLKARPTVYRGIQMRSRLEATFAQGLDASGVRWEYEPRAYAGPAGQYLPDFQLFEREWPVFIEVRPTIDRAYSAMARMQIIWDSEPEARLSIFVADCGYFYTNRHDPTWIWTRL